MSTAPRYNEITGHDRRAADGAMGKCGMTNGFNGYFEGIRADGWATGWVHRTDGGSDKANVSVSIDGVEAIQLPADQFREDLLAADFPDPGCAFLYRIPDSFVDDAEHRIDIAFADTGMALPNSPQLFTLAPPAAIGPVHANLVPNAGFARWPHGVSVTPNHRLQEGPEGWLVDFWRGIPPGATLAVDRPAELALSPEAFALRITVSDPITGYLRLIVPLAVDTLAPGLYHLGLGLRRPPVGANGDLHIANIFLAAVDDVTVTHVVGIRRNIRVGGTTRLHGISFDLDDANAAHFGNDIRPALVFELLGHGVLQLFEPDLSGVPRPRHAALVSPGTFEDPAIAGQVGLLALSPLWGADRPAVPVRPAATARAGAVALPFVQIVVPVFNAGADVDELVTSLLEHADSPFELLLTDDASQPFTEQRLQRWTARDPRIRLLRNEANLGYTRNINRALQSTVASHVVLLNSDAVVTQGWLARLFEAMAAAPDVAAVGPLSNAASWQSVPLTRDSDGRWSSNPLTAGISIERMASAVAACSEAAFPEFPLLNGFCTLFRRDALEAVGWFDDGTFPQGYGEENDLCLRLGQSGWRLRVADHAYVHHKKSRSFGPIRRAELSRSASKSLRAKHPAIAIEALEAVMQGSEPINRLRSRLVATLRAEQVI